MPLDQEAVAVPVGRTATAQEHDSAQQRTIQTDSKQNRHHESAACLTPPIDIYEGSDGLVLEADLPGVPDHLVSIQLEENVLNLRGQVEAYPLPDAKALHVEYRPGDFGRSFILSDEVDRSKITASLRNGVLRITLPKAEPSQARRIEIKTS